MEQIERRVRDDDVSADWVQKLRSVLVVDCEFVELARAMLRDYNERRQMAQQHLPMPAITRALMSVG